MAMNWYNENDPRAAAWLRELIRMGEIPDGVVDERSILDVRAEDLRDFTQCHFFAGIGGWPLALRLAGWPATRPVWTGSPPCQPFSQAGAQLGVLDERHLAPAFLDLVGAVRPAVVFGEQVAAAVRKDAWLDDLLDALEASGYATGAAVLPSCGVGAPHLRQRIWFVGRLAYSGDSERRSVDERRGDGRNGKDAGREKAHGELGARSEIRGLANAADERWNATGSAREASDEYGKIERFAGLRGVGELADCTPNGRRQERANAGWCGQGDESQGRTPRLDSGGDVGRLADAERQRLQDDRTQGSDEGGTVGRAGAVVETDATHGGWETVDWLFCRDGKWRPTQPGIFPLAHGIPKGMVRGGDSGEPDVDATQEARVGRLRGYGNAIVAPLAAKVVRAVMEGTQ